MSSSIESIQSPNHLLVLSQASRRLDNDNDTSVAYSNRSLNQQRSSVSTAVSTARRPGSGSNAGGGELKRISSFLRENEEEKKMLLNYKSGVMYEGGVKDSLRSGFGVFEWPNGDRYEGEFRNNSRHGRGMQTWNDGSSYEGEFMNDKRVGSGVHRSNQGHIYEGQWFVDFRNGYGKYKWNDSNLFEGFFFMNNRFGYGKLFYTNGDYFVGLYKQDIRFGPGLLKYPNNDEDVGYWNGDKLVRLLVPVDATFVYNQLDPIDKSFEVKSWYDRETILHDTLKPQNIFLNNVFSNRAISFIKTDPYVDKVIEQKKLVHEHFLNAVEDLIKRVSAGDNENKKMLDEFLSNRMVDVANLTPQLREIFLHFKQLTSFNKIFTRFFNFDLTAFEHCTRERFSSPGLLETSSIEFLNACDEKNLEKMKALRNLVSVDVCDSRGYSPLIISVLRCDAPAINFLLDNGANVNHLMDNGLSGLMICMIRYYTSDKFLPNTALKHQDLMLTRRINPDSIVVPNEDELIIIKEVFEKNKLYKSKSKELHDFRLFLRNYDEEIIDADKLNRLEPTSAVGNKAIEKYLSLAEKLKLKKKSKKARGESPSRRESSKQKPQSAVKDETGSITKQTNFESDNSLIKYKIEPTDELVEQYANLMKDRSNDSTRVNLSTEAKVLEKTNQLHFLNEVSSIIELLLRRGADPSLTSVPYPALCFAVAAGDVKIVRLLLEKGADCNKRMPKKYASLTPLCLACGVLGETGPELVKLLLDSLADPNAAADVGTEYLSMCEEGWQSETLSDEIVDLVGGRTPLHIACCRNDPHASKVIKLLLDHSSNPNLICNGQSPLSLAIASGNKEAVDLLLKSNKCDPNLPLNNGVGSALCVISSTLYEHNWTPHERIKLVNKLMHYGADILQPVAFGPRRLVGTVVDYAFYMYNSDNRIAHTPYHSLTINERNTYNARRDLLNHLSFKYREKAMERDALLKVGANLNPTNKKMWGPAIKTKRTEDIDPEKRFPKWCYYCGRCVAVKLMPCTRCHKVYYCSNNCKQKAWEEWHKEECELPESYKRYLSAQRKKKEQLLKEQLLKEKKDKRIAGISKNAEFDGEPDNYSYN